MKQSPFNFIIPVIAFFVIPQDATAQWTTTPGPPTYLQPLGNARAGIGTANPNPNPGTFTVELPEAVIPDMIFRIVGLTGQLLREQPTQGGSATQIVHAETLPSGLYFQQVMSEGRVLAVEKFVKQ